jgi:uncharacterized delta-60 repeat protein
MNYKSASSIDAVIHSFNLFFMKKILFIFIAIFALIHAYSQAGSLDPTFAGKGLTAADIKRGNLYSETGGQMLLQKDSSYIVVFEVNSYTVLTHLGKNGTIDTKFGTGGYSDPAPIYQPKAVLQSDGKIVVAGQTDNLNTGNSDFALARYNSNGSLDNTFDGDGKQTTDFFGDHDFAYSLAIQTDGKIVVAGKAYNKITNNFDFALARYNSNGSLDNTFDGDGKLNTDFFGSDDGASALAIQLDGKIVVAGQAINPNTNDYDFALARYNSNGTLDNTFDGDGKQTTNFFGGYDFVYSLAIQLDRKIVVAGQAFNSNTNNNDFALARYNSNGSLDNTFDGDGKLTTNFNGGNDIAYSLALQQDGKIVVAGQAVNPNTGNDFALARYNSSGSLDNTFDGDGKLTTNFNGGNDIAYSLIVQKNGKIIVAGQAFNPNTNNYDFALACYNGNETLDNTFDRDGKLTGFYLPIDTKLAAIVLQTDGKIVVAGQAFNPNTNNYDFALARYNSNGSLDTSFDRDGKQTTDFIGGNDYAYALAIQTNGKIVVAGVVYNPNTGQSDFALARYNSNGSLDNTFDGDGKLTTDLGGNDYATSLAIQADGKIVAAGRAVKPDNTTDFSLARYNSNGSLDNTFDGDGKLTTDFGSFDIAFALAIQADGKIVVAGTDGGNFGLARYNSNGSLDNTFDGDGKLTTDFGFVAYALAIQTDGKIVAAGQAGNGFALARYNSNGSLDNTFDGDGKQTTDFGGYDAATSLAIQADGKIVAAGYAVKPNTLDYDFALARYNSNGSLDNTFEGDGKVTTDLNGGDDYAAAVAIRNNRIYITGSSIAAASRGIVAAYQTGTTALKAPPITSVAPLKVPQSLTQTLRVSVLPNPSTQFFILKLQSSESNSTVTVSITDAGGRLLEMKNNVNANSSLQLGYNYPPGIYFTQIVQGTKKEVVKLIKQ